MYISIVCNIHYNDLFLLLLEKNKTSCLCHLHTLIRHVIIALHLVVLLDKNFHIQILSFAEDIFITNVIIVHTMTHYHNLIVLCLVVHQNVYYHMLNLSFASNIFLLNVIIVFLIIVYDHMSCHYVIDYFVLIIGQSSL